MEPSEEDSENKSQYSISQESALFDPEKQARVRERVRKLREKNQAN